jgi:hypothetical protein
VVTIESTVSGARLPRRAGEVPTAVAPGLRPFYFAAIFWGQVYREYFTDLLLASLLSPNNIPALNRRRGNKFLIAAPRTDWDAIQGHPMVRLLRTYVEPEWLNLEVSPDDHRMDRKMRAMSRGHRLAASRAFEDRAYGVFVTPDLILSDGSVAAMERLAEAGKKVVLAVAIRYQHEPVLAELDRAGYLRHGQPLAIGSRDLMRAALRYLHSETLRYEYEAPWFAASPVSVYWRVPRGAGMIIYSFSWAPLVVDYGALAYHDTKTFDQWTLDGDYIYRNFPAPSDVHVITDSDEIALVSFTKESDLHFELRPYLAGRPRWIADWYKVRLIRALKDSSVIDPLKRHIFPTPVYLHSGDLSPAWARKRRQTARVIARVCEPDAPARRRERMISIGACVCAPDLWLALGLNATGEGGRIHWFWRYRRFVWQRVKERLGLVRGRSRVDDGRDWVTPALGAMHPIWSMRVVLRWSWRHRRFLWQRVKEKVGLVRGRSRVDDGRDWVTPALGPMHPIWSLRVVLGWSWRYRRFLWQRAKEKVGLAEGRSRVDDGRDWVSRPRSVRPLWSIRAGRPNGSTAAYRPTEVPPKARDADADTEIGYPR